jgi:hypothetical protein
VPRNWLRMSPPWAATYLGLPRFAKAARVVTYIKRNAAVIPNYGERRHYVAPIFKTARPFWLNGTLTGQ